MNALQMPLNDRDRIIKRLLLNGCTLPPLEQAHNHRYDKIKNSMIYA